MQNEPNSRKAKMNVTSYITKDYENIADWTLGENEPKQSQFPKSQNECNLLFNKGLRKKRRFRSPKKQSQFKANLLNAQMNVSTVYTKHYENARLRGRGKNKPNQTQSEILNQKSQIHSHPAGNKLHTPRRQSWGCFALSGRTTPKTAGLDFSLAALNYYRQTADKNMRA